MRASRARTLVGPGLRLSALLVQEITVYSYHKLMGNTITTLGSKQQTGQQETGQDTRTGRRTADYDKNHGESASSRTTHACRVSSPRLGFSVI